MKKDVVLQYQALADLLDEREIMYEKNTEAIFKLIGPSVLEALYKIFNVPYENVSWLEVQVVESILMLVASVVYTEENKEAANVVEQLSPTLPDGTNLTGRIFRVGIPIELTFAPIEDITKYLEDRIKATIDKQQTGVNEQLPYSVPINAPRGIADFDASQLTSEQIQQIIMFQDATKGTRH